MTNTTTKKSAVKGTVAAAAGIAVLLGGAGTFALWNASGAIGSASTSTGELRATISTETVWKDVTSGAANNEPISIANFKMVPGDTVVGTTDVKVTATGENLKVNAKLDYSGTTLPEGVTATMTLTNDDAPGTEVTTLSGSETPYDLTATVTLNFDAGNEGTESMQQSIDLTKVNIDLQQTLNTPAKG